MAIRLKFRIYCCDIFLLLFTGMKKFFFSYFCFQRLCFLLFCCKVYLLQKYIRDLTNAAFYERKEWWSARYNVKEGVSASFGEQVLVSVDFDCNGEYDRSDGIRFCEDRKYVILLDFQIRILYICIKQQVFSFMNQSNRIRLVWLWQNKATGLLSEQICQDVCSLSVDVSAVLNHIRKYYFVFQIYGRWRFD